MELSWIHIAIVGAAAGIGLGATYVLKLKPDNVIEQMSEQVIKMETGKEIDLSPEKEDNK